MIIVILSVITTIFAATILFLGVALNAQVTKVENLEKELDKYDEYVLEYHNMLKETYIRLKEVDDRNLFEKDDDVGGTFRDIVNIIEEISRRSDIVTDASKVEKTDI